jgi:hypothetical protein
MSDGLAIAAATATLRRLLDKGLEASVTVTASPLDKARTGGGPQVNLFLYLTQIDGAWRNQDIPGRVKAGETGFPPLPLALFYLLTAYHDDKDEVQGQKLLGRAMQVLHDHPLLGSAEIKDALPDSDLHEQIERVRINPQSLPVDEISKLWSAFQTPYRTSVAYQVSVVLIESARSARAPLPVLRRGEDDRGVTSQPDLIPPFPELSGLVLPGKQTSARLGDELVLRGHHLDQGTLSVRFTNPHLTDTVPVQVLFATASEVRIKLLAAADDPTAPKKWVAGFYTVALVLKDGDRVRATNELPLAIAPRITTAPADVTRGPAPDFKAEITLKCGPQVRPAQRVSMLWGDLEVPAQDHPTQTNSFDFKILHAPLGKRFLRLRIDGVDSFLIDPAADPPAFDLTKMLEIK